MGAAIAHRGPDDSATFFDADAGIGFAHQRLAILDLSPLGRQPMADQSGRFTICYNGEVYNFGELRAELTARGVTFRGTSDTEVILELIAREGLGALGRLNGIFALALWDSETRELHLVRDGLGIKPLYWTRTRSGVAFASEIKALLPLPDLTRDLDTIAAASYLSYLFSPGERTMFASVKKLEPGLCLTLTRAGTARERRFYALPVPDPEPTGPSAAIAGMRDMLDQAVRRQLVADVDVGAFLSGGLDSSAIVAMARNHVAPGALPCFTIDYAAKKGDDRELVSDLPYAREAARHLGVPLHEVRVGSDMAHDFPALVEMLDEPQADPAALNNFYISRLAREMGIKVLLSGAGGDDLLTGYRRHQAAYADGTLGRLPGQLRRVIASGAQRLPLGRSLTRRLRKTLSHLGEDECMRIVRMFEWTAPEHAAELLASVEEKAALASSVRKPMLDGVREPGLHSGVDRALRIDQRFFLTDHNLNYTDKTGMAASVEIRVPYLDVDLIEWAATLPPSVKLRGGQTKWVLRKAMEGILPSGIIYRPKTGFGVPLRAWMRDELRPIMDELLSVPTIEARGLFEPRAVTQLRQATQAGQLDGSYALLAVATIELWCRRFVDQSDNANQDFAPTANFSRMTETMRATSA
jgi:asparagine synthase (glutamine-hydrolysing)